MTSNTGTTFETQVQRLARNGMALAAGGVIAQLAFTLLEVLVARKLGAEAYGIFVTAYAWTVLGSFLMEIGTPLWTIQEGSRRHGKIPELLGSALSVNFVMFTVLYLALLIVTGLITTNSVLTFLVIILPYGLILTLQNVLAAVYSCYQTMQINAFFQGLAPVAILICYFAWAAGDLSLNDVGYAYILGGGIITAIWFAKTVRRIRPTVSVASVRRTLRSSYSYGLSGILGQVYFKTDIVMLSAIAGLREAGIYAAAFKLVELLYKVAVLSGRVFAPAVFKASRETGKNFHVLASMMTRVLAVVGLVAAITSVLMAEELILLLFGEHYAGSIPVLRILAGVMATRCLMVALQLLLSSIDLHFQRVAYLVAAIAVQIGAGLVLIPRFGAVGAAMATLSSGLLIILLYAVSSARKGGFHFFRWLLIPSVLASAVAALAMLSGLNALVQTIAAILVFLLSLIAVRFIRRDEIEFVFRSVAPKKRD